MTTNKIIMLGNCGVGKTTLLNQYVNQNANLDGPTIGVQHYSILHNQVNLSIWDTAGQEKYRSIISTHFKRTKAAILVFDCSNQQSLIDLDKWVEDLIFHVGQNAILAIVANKTDLINFEIQPKIDEFKEKYDICITIMTNHQDPELKSKFNSLLDEILKKMGIITPAPAQPLMSESRAKEQIFSLKAENKISSLISNKPTEVQHPQQQDDCTC